MCARQKNAVQLGLLGLLYFILHFRHVNFPLYEYWIPGFYITVFCIHTLGTVYSFSPVLKILVKRLKKYKRPYFSNASLNQYYLNV